MQLNAKGSLHITTIVILILALFGAWYAYKSYKQNILKENVLEAINGYRNIIEENIGDPQDKRNAREYLQKIQEIIKKYQPAPEIDNPTP